MLRSLVGLFLFGVSFYVMAGEKYYVCIDDQGRKSFQSDTCDGKADPVELKKAEDLVEERRRAALDHKKSAEERRQRAEDVKKERLESDLRSSIKSRDEYKKDSAVLCSNQWTKRGSLDLDMYAYCIKGHAESYEKLVRVDRMANMQNFYVNYAYPYCEKAWTKRGVVDVSMLVHCLKKEIEGVKDVQFYREKYGDAVDVVAGQALEQYGSWNMVAYSVKKALGLD